MRYLVICLFLSFVVFSGCVSTEPMGPYESEDLVVVQHNDYNSYLLMVYRDPLGQTRQILRKNGMTEVMVTYLLDGTIQLKTRGKKEREINVIEAGHITQRINSLLEVSSAEKASLASI